MRVAVWHNLPSGGGKRALYYHLRGLHQRGHQLEVWCPPTADRTYLPLTEFATEHIVEMEWPAPKGWADKFKGRLGVFRALEAMGSHCRACADQINAGSFDILFANSCQFFGVAPISRFSKVPSVLYLQEPYRTLYEALPRLRWLALPDSRHSWISPNRWRELYHDWYQIRSSRIQAREEVENAAAFGRILCNSFFSRESILRAYGLDSDVCYLGVDTDEFRDLRLARENFLMGVGSFTPAKNIGLVIEAIGLLPDPRPELVWVGNLSSPYLEGLIALAKARGVDFSPFFRVSDNELVNLLNKATAMVYAPRLEPFGLAPIEAGACALPVIAVAEGGVRETVVDGVTGLLVNNDPRSMADAIALLLEDPALARKLGDRGKANVDDHWSLEALINRIEQKLLQYAQSNPIGLASHV